MAICRTCNVAWSNIICRVNTKMQNLRRFVQEHAKFVKLLIWYNKHNFHWWSINGSDECFLYVLTLLCHPLVIYFFRDISLVGDYWENLTLRNKSVHSHHRLALKTFFERNFHRFFVRLWSREFALELLCSRSVLNHFGPMFHFYTPENVRKLLVFWHFQGGIEMDHWAKIG